MFWKFNDLDAVINLHLPLVEGSPPGFMSPFTGGTGNPYSASVAITGDDKAYEVVGLAKIDGLIFGMFQVSSCPLPYFHSIEKKAAKTHAEDGFVSAFEQFTKTKTYDALAAAHKITKTKFSVTLKLNKTPCQHCAPMLIAFAEKHTLSLRIKAMRQYKGNNKKEQDATRSLVDNGIPVIPFNIPAKARTTQYDKNRFGQFHELKFARFDEIEFKEDNASEEVKAVVDEYKIKHQLIIQTYQQSFDEKEDELSGVVLNHLVDNNKSVESEYKEFGKTKGFEDTNARKDFKRKVLSAVYKTDKTRVNRSRFEEFAGVLYKTYPKFEISEQKLSKKVQDGDGDDSARKKLKQEK
jgi:hypothetical protein